jgi:hypothetical protein
MTSVCRGPGSSVSIATDYGLDGLGIESRWRRDFPHLPSLLYDRYRVFLRLESGWGVTLTPHPLLMPRSKKQSKAIPLLSLRAFVACKKGKTYLQVFDLRSLQGTGM